MTSAHRADAVTYTRRVINESWDGGDPWGSAIEAMFAVCEALHHRGGDVPDSWQFRHSPVQCDPDGQDCRAESYVLDGLLDGFDAGRITLAELISEGDVLSEECADLEAAGKSY